MTNEEYVEEMLKNAMENNLPRNDMWNICITSITESLAFIAGELKELRKCIETTSKSIQGRE